MNQDEIKTITDNFNKFFDGYANRFFSELDNILNKYDEDAKSDRKLLDLKILNSVDSEESEELSQFFDLFKGNFMYSLCTGQQMTSLGERMTNQANAVTNEKRIGEILNSVKNLATFASEYQPNVASPDAYKRISESKNLNFSDFDNNFNVKFCEDLWGITTKSYILYHNYPQYFPVKTDKNVESLFLLSGNSNRSLATLDRNANIYQVNKNLSYEDYTFILLRIYYVIYVKALIGAKDKLEILEKNKYVFAVSALSYYFSANKDEIQTLFTREGLGHAHGATETGDFYGRDRYVNGVRRVGR